MNSRITKFLFGFLFLPALSSASAPLPEWITAPLLDEGQYSNVICSHEALDPDKARTLAEDKCYLSAARSQGVDLKIVSKSTQTLTASEVSESVEAQPIIKFVKCDFQKQFLERNNESYRVWLKCRFLKNAIKPQGKETKEESKQPISQESTTSAQGNSVIRLLMVPKPEVILIQNDSLPEKVLRNEIEQNMAIDLRKGDKTIILKHHLYKDYIIDLGNLKDGEVQSRSVHMEKEL